MSGQLTHIVDGRAWPIIEEEFIFATAYSGAVRIDNEDGARSGTWDAYIGLDFPEWSQLQDGVARPASVM